MSTTTLPRQSNNSSDQVTSKVNILQRIAAGEQPAVDECVQEYGPLIWSLASRFCQHKADAEDASQEIFLAIWQNAAKFDPAKAKEITFVSMLARRRLIDRYRRKTIPDSVDVDSLDVSVMQPSDQQLETNEEAAKAASCFGELAEVQQQVLGLSIHDGVSHGGIASQLKIPLGTVKSYARRGLLQLRDCMKSKSAFVGGGVQ